MPQEAIVPLRDETADATVEYGGDSDRRRHSHNFSGELGYRVLLLGIHSL